MSAAASTGPEGIPTPVCDRGKLIAEKLEAHRASPGLLATALINTLVKAVSLVTTDLLASFRKIAWFASPLRHFPGGPPVSKGQPGKRSRCVLPRCSGRISFDEPYNALRLAVG